MSGKTIAFEEPGSTSAFLVPLAELRALFEYSKTVRFDKIKGDAALAMEQARCVFKLVRPDMR